MNRNRTTRCLQMSRYSNSNIPNEMYGTRFWYCLLVAYVGATSAAVNIPTNGVTRGSLGSLSQESPPSSLGSLPPAFVPQHIQQQQKQEQQIEQVMG